MKYDFTSMIDRRGQDALAVDGVGKMDGFAPTAPKEGFDLIPLWVADMNFKTAPAVTQAIEERLRHPLFGYYETRPEYYDEIIRWQQERNGVQGLAKEHIGYENGVLGGIMSAVRVMAAPGDAVLLHSPTYIGFTGSLQNGGYRIVHSPLKPDKDHIWRMDYADMEEKIRANHIHTVIFCSPHNPTGRVWEREELEQAYEIFRRNECTVISDEIWSDILMPGQRHIPLQSVSDDAKARTAAFYAPSKTFNLAGLIGSYHIIYDPALRDRVRSQSSKTHYNSMNVLSMHALIGAYSREGAEWVDEMRQVIAENVNYAVSYIREHFAGVDICAPQGTYMLFADCTDWCREHGKSIEELEQACWDVGCAVQDGKMFHGPCHLRINLASPTARIREAMERMDRYVFNV